jgi:hypothetical protein
MMEHKKNAPAAAGAELGGSLAGGTGCQNTLTLIITRPGALVKPAGKGKEHE